MLGGAKSAIPATDAVVLERSLEAETAQLNKTVERSRKISQVVEFGVSFVHPAALVAVTIKNLSKEYRMSGDMQWSTGLMLVASALALRHASMLKGALEGIEATVAGKALRGAEIGIGITLSGVGAKSIYDQLASGKSLKDVSFEAAMLFVPLAYATVRPVAANKVRAFAGRRFEALMERDWSEQAAASSSMERLRLEFSQDGKLVEAHPESASVTIPDTIARSAQPSNLSGRNSSPTEVSASQAKTDASASKSANQAKTAALESPTKTNSNWASEGVKETVLETTAVDESISRSVLPAQPTEPVNSEQLNHGKVLLSAINNDQPRFFSDFSKLDADRQAGVLAALRTVSPDSATQLSEFAALRNLAKEYGMLPEKLESVYSAETSLLSARASLLCYIESTGRIDFGLNVRRSPIGSISRAENLVGANPSLISLLLSEDIIGNLRSSYPGQVQEGAMITGLKYHGGLRGTFEVTLRMPDDSMLSFYAKRGDSRSARLGANSSMEAGHPAPQVSAVRVLKDHTTGKPGLYWFMPSIQNFTGTLKIAGREIAVQETVEAFNMKQVVTATGSSSNNLLVSHPDIYYRELGRAQAGWMQSGIYDAHELNTYAMFVHVSKEDGAFLNRNGYHVEPDGGRSKLFIFGRIDTDWSGSYGAIRDGTGSFTFLHMFPRLARHDIARIFTRNVTQRSTSPGELTPETLSLEAHKDLEGARHHFIEGVSEWYRTNGSDPSYVAGMKKLFTDNRGNAIGFDKNLSDQELADLRQNGQILDPRMPFNGSAARPIDFEDGRSRFVPENAISAFDSLRGFFGDKANLNEMWNTILNIAKEGIARLAKDELNPSSVATKKAEQSPAAKAAKP